MVRKVTRASTKFSHCPAPDSSSVSSAQAHISSSPGQSWWATDLCKGLQPLQTSQDACNVAPANIADLVLSPGMSSDEGKNQSSPFLFQITCTALDVTKKTSQTPDMSLAEEGNIQYKNPQNKVQMEWKDL